jgi:hypothetical protein
MKLSQQQMAARMGRAAEYAAMAWLLRNNDVWVSDMPDAASTDLMVVPRRNPRRRLSVQVKMAYRKRGTKKLCVNLSKADGGRYNADEVDFVLAVDMAALHFWVLPVGMLAGQSRIVLGDKYVGCGYTWDQAVIL